MTSLDKTWKDEAIAFVFLAISLIFAMRAWDFFIASQNEKAPRLQAYQPRRNAPEQIIQYIEGPQRFGRGLVMMGTGSVFGGMISYDTGSPSLFYGVGVQNP